jgi:hypothetical protein
MIVYEAIPANYTNRRVPARNVGLRDRQGGMQSSTELSRFYNSNFLLSHPVSRLSLKV